MPLPSLRVDWTRFNTESNRLLALAGSLDDLPIAHRKLVAEIAMIRLFLLTENTIASVGAKLLCGATYLDGTIPQALVAARSISSAVSLMKSHHRTTPKPYLTWTKSTGIRGNLSRTLDPSDPFFHAVKIHAANLTEMRYVRNHIAHGSEGTRVDFRKVIRRHYGGLKRGLTPGVFLLSPPTGPTTNLVRYLRYCRVAVSDIVRA